MIVLFHKPAWKSTDEGFTRQFTLNIEKYKVSDDGSNINVYFKAVWRRLIAIENTFIIPKPEHPSNEVYELWYNTTSGVCILKDFTIIDPYSATFGAPTSTERVYLGRIHFESDTKTLLYLAGRFDYDYVTEAIEEVIMAEDGESSVQAMSHYSEQAKKLLDKVALKRNFLKEIDYLDSISYLEAQLDIATRVIMYLAEQQGLQNTQLYQMLSMANDNSVFRIKDPEQVLTELDYKGYVRDKQLAYYSNKKAIEGE